MKHHGTFGTILLPATILHRIKPFLTHTRVHLQQFHWNQVSIQFTVGIVMEMEVLQEQLQIPKQMS